MRAARRGRLTFSSLITIAFLAAVTVRATLVPAQNDTYWHLRAGAEIWRTHAVPRTNDWSFTFPGHEWVDHEWLYQACIYALHRVGGMALVTVVTGLGTMATVVIVWRRLRSSVWRRALLIAAALPVILSTGAVRPQVFSLLLLVAFVALLERGTLWPLPLLMLVWANLHGAFVFGLLAVLVALVAAVLWERTRVRSLGVCFAATLVATLITPTGLGSYLYLAGKSNTLDIEEWRPLVRFPVVAVLVALVAVVLVAATIATHPRQSWADRFSTLLAAVLFVFAVRYVRVAPAFVLIALPPIAHAWEARRPVRSRADEPSVLNAVLAAVVVAGAGVWIAAAMVAPVATLNWNPISESARVALRDCRGPLYNRYDDGGYVEWYAQGRPVFVDSRLDPYPIPFLESAFASDARGDADTILRSWPVTCALLPPGSSMVQALQDRGWRLEYADNDWMVLHASQ